MELFAKSVGRIKSKGTGKSSRLSDLRAINRRCSRPRAHKVGTAIRLQSGKQGRTLTRTPFRPTIGMQHAFLEFRLRDAFWAAKLNERGIAFLDGPLREANALFEGLGFAFLPIESVYGLQEVVGRQLDAILFLIDLDRELPHQNGEEKLDDGGFREILSRQTIRRVGYDNRQARFVVASRESEIGAKVFQER